MLRAQLRLPEGSAWCFAAADGGGFSVEDIIWVDGAGEQVPVRRLVSHDVVGGTGGIYAWRLNLIG